jgi:hypothetical protein
MVPHPLEIVKDSGVNLNRALLLLSMQLSISIVSGIHVLVRIPAETSLVRKRIETQLRKGLVKV